MTTYTISKTDFDLLVQHHPFDHDTIQAEADCPKCQAMRRTVRSCIGKGPFANPDAIKMHQALYDEMKCHLYAEDGGLSSASKRQMSEHLSWQRQRAPWLVP